MKTETKQRASLFCVSWLLFWLLWNAIVVPVFHAPELNFWQVGGLKILFNSVFYPFYAKTEEAGK